MLVLLLIYLTVDKNPQVSLISCSFHFHQICTSLYEPVLFIGMRIVLKKLVKYTDVAASPIVKTGVAVFNFHQPTVWDENCVRSDGNEEFGSRLFIQAIGSVRPTLLNKSSKQFCCVCGLLGTENTRIWLYHFNVWIVVNIWISYSHHWRDMHNCSLHKSNVSTWFVVMFKSQCKI